MRLPFLLAAIPLLAQEPLDLRKERALGPSLAAETRLDSWPLGIRAVSEYVDSIGGRLVRALDSRRFEYRFDVVVTPEGDQPFGYPGGFVFVPARFFLSVRDEAEFAAGQAHAAAHVELRHGLGSATALAARDRRSPLVFLGTRAGSHTAGHRSSPVVPAGLRELRRIQEMDADGFVIPMLAKAGFDPGGLRRLVTRDGQEGLPPERLERLEASMVLAGTPAVVEDESFVRVREFFRAALPARRANPPSLRR